MAYIFQNDGAMSFTGYVYLFCYLYRCWILMLLQIDSDEQTPYNIILQNAETVALICPGQG